MRKSDYHYLLGLLKDNAGWDFDDDEYFIIDKKMYNFVREKGYASVEELIAELKWGRKRCFGRLSRRWLCQKQAFIAIIRFLRILKTRFCRISGS